MRNHVVHVSDVEAANDFQSLLAAVRDGAEVIIEHDTRPVAVLRAAEPSKSLAEAFAAISRDISKEDWARVPTDLSKHVDHYLYGTCKVT